MSRPATPTFARYTSDRRRQSRRPLRLESLEPRQLLAVTAIPDNYNATEDTPLDTTALGSTVVVPFQSNWTRFEGITRVAPNNVYPDTGAAPRWRDVDYNTATPTFGTWAAAASAPFARGTVDGFNTAPIGPATPTALDINYATTGTDTLVTALFRTNFDGGAGGVMAVSGRFLCDDGCKLYVNGAPVGRVRMPEANLTDEASPGANATGTAAVESTIDSFTMSGVTINAGTNNVFAVELHQVQPGSSDFGFAAELSLGAGESLLANDDLTAANGTVAVALVGQPTDTGSNRIAGTVTLNTTTGNFRFVPTANYPSPLFGDSGVATFDYTITDTDGSSTATATINVAAVNDAPVADGEEYTFSGSFAITQALAGTEYIAAGADWFYSDDNSDQRTVNPNWNQSGFDPSTATGWHPTAAPAEFGYGEGDEATTIDCGPVAGNECTPTVNNQANKNITSYFQRTFNIAGIPSTLRLGLMRDDGAIVSINGVEVHRTASLTNCAAAVSHTTLAACSAAGAVGGADEDRFFIWEFPTAGLNLQPTGNTIAVEVHQQAANSSDFSFNARLSSGAVGLVANDTDADDSPATLTVEVVSQAAFTPAVGTLNVASDGKFTFTPANSSVTGDFPFTYRLVDSATATSNTVTVTLHVRPGSTCSFDADLDNDGDVDRVDLAAFTRAYTSTTAGASGGDINCDARVTLDDLLELKRRYGQSLIDAARSPGDDAAGGLPPGAVDQVLSGSRNEESSVVDASTRPKWILVERDTGSPLAGARPSTAAAPAQLRARRHARATSSVRAE